ncbi:MAG: hypothetical protein KGD73_11895 [Candidatus Lokiarchaeota archaeon]|nr:hypothetical protein [Candidatus Lokiarchaeota archaeon]
MAKKPPIVEDESDVDQDLSLGDEDKEDSEEDEDFEEEEEEIIEKKDYKHVSLELTKGLNENDHVLLLKGQTHGFCNALVKQLLPLNGVISAAYRITTIKPAEIFIRLEDGYKIMDILFESIESLRNEGQEAYEIFKKLI